jgi:hypothetical protein
VDADGPAAVGASPADFFIRHKLPNAEPLDVFEILDGAHVIFRPISLVHVLYPFTGVTVTLEAELQISLLKDFAVFDFAPESGDGLVRVFHPAPRTGIFVS